MNNSSDVCLQLTPDEIATYAAFHFWVDDVTERIVGSAGLVANLVAIIILTRKRMASNFNLLLTVLAICDSFFIIFSFVEEVESSLNSMINFASFFNLLWYPFYHMAMTASIYMTICLSFERYRALILNPTKFNSTNTKEGRRATFIWAVLIILFAILINVPKFFELTFSSEGRLVLSELYNDYYFVLIYDNIVRNLVLVVIPFVGLTFLNLSIFFKLRERLDLHTGQRQRLERQTFAVLFGVVLVLAACHALRIFLVIRLLISLGCTRVQERFYISFLPIVKTTHTKLPLTVIYDFSYNFHSFSPSNT